MTTLDALFTQRNRNGQLAEILYRRDEVQPVGKRVTLKRFMSLVKKEGVRKAKAKKAAGRAKRKKRGPRKRKANRIRRAEPAPAMNIPTESGAIYIGIAAKMCGAGIKTIERWARDGLLKFELAVRFCSRYTREVRMCQLAEVERVCIAQNVGNFKRLEFIIGGKSYLVVKEAARRAGRSTQTIQLWARQHKIKTEKREKLAGRPENLYSWSDIQNELKVGRKKL